MPRRRPVPFGGVKLFVTGGAGFIGSNYVHHVLETTDDEVTLRWDAPPDARALLDTIMSFLEAEPTGS